MKTLVYVFILLQWIFYIFELFQLMQLYSLSGSNYSIFDLLVFPSDRFFCPSETTMTVFKIDFLPSDMTKYFRFILYIWASLVAQLVKNPPAMQTWVQPLGWEDLLEKGKATHQLQYSGQENPWVCKDSDMTEQCYFHLSHIFITLNWNKLFLQRILIRFSKKHLQAII